MREQLLLDFYNHFVDYLYSEDVSDLFDKIILMMLYVHECSEFDLLKPEYYELLLLNNFTSVVNDENLKAIFYKIDYEYYNFLLNSNELSLEIIKLMELISKMNYGMIEFNNLFNSYYMFLELKKIKRVGWIKRGVSNEYIENDVIHTIQMFGLASVYFRIYKPQNMDYRKILEMIFIHEIGEVVTGDIAEGEKEHVNKHDFEFVGVKKAFANLKDSDYFINLWNEFEDRETNEAKFVYLLDKMDPVLKAKYLDEKLGREDLFKDFSLYEENRRTFVDNELTDVFKLVNTKTK